MTERSGSGPVPLPPAVADRRPPSFDVPDQGDEPVAWDPQARAFVPVAGPGPAARQATG